MEKTGWTSSSPAIDLPQPGEVLMDLIRCTFVQMLMILTLFRIDGVNTCLRQQSRDKRDRKATGFPSSPRLWHSVTGPSLFPAYLYCFNENRNPSSTWLNISEPRW